MTTIPASAIVSVTPNVLAAGGSALDLIGLMLTTSTRPPIGSVPAFPSALAVGDYFGASSTEKALADIYFAGFENSNVRPGSLLFAQYPTLAVAAFVRGGDVSALTLAEIQALNGLLALTIDGVLKSATINLAASTSFSSAAKIIQAGLGIAGPSVASITGSISGTTLTVSAVSSGSLAVNSVLTGTGVTTATRVTALLTGTGGAGTYTVDTSQTALSEAITARAPGVYYDSVSGAFIIQSGTLGANSTITAGSGALATSLLLTSLTGAVTSQGAAAAEPSAFMDGVVQVTQNWATFMTIFDPDASGNDNKYAFAEWTSAQDDRYAYACWDTDLSPSVSAPATSSLGYLIAQAELSGTILIGQDVADTDLEEVAAFVCSFGASLDFEQTNGRATLAFRRQAGLTGTASSEATSVLLMANGYNFYGPYATANDEFTFFYPGSISGDFLWADSYLNEIWMNNAFQLALMTLLTQSLSIPYNVAGRSMIEAAVADPIAAALNFGAIRQGVTLSASQIAAVNAAAGVRISDTLTQVGSYFQVLDASAAVRAARQSPPCTFWYTDGQSVQQLDLSSVEIQ